MKKCIVLGGGIAGLTAASYLVNSGIKVTLLESSPKLGGRAYSFKLPGKNESIDNGQHILMGCYRDTLSFLKLIGADKNFSYQKRLSITFINSDGKKLKLKSLPIPYPLNLLTGFLKYKALDFKERLKVIKLMLKLPFISYRSLLKKNVFEWLTDEDQNEEIINSFWEMIAVGALNTNIYKASAAVFHNILVQMFYGGNAASTIILPKYGLTECYVNNAKDYIEQQGGEIIVSDKVEKIVIDQDELKEIKTTKRIYSDFDFVISALPPYSVEKLIPSGYLKGEINFTYSSILNMHIWLKKNPFNEKFYGLLNSPVHWMFNKGTHINLVISNAGYLMDKTDSELLNICTAELKKYCDIDKDEITGYKILKEKRATFIPSVDSVYTRPSSRTEINNLFLAGDWTDTALPSTIESAAKSGRVAVELALSKV